HFQGSLGAKNWCTGATSRAMLDGLRQMGFVPTESDETKFVTHLQQLSAASGTKMTIRGQDAFAAPLLPGDMVMFLFKDCQYGGHTATAVEDLGASFIQVSGNPGDAIGVGISEFKRLTTVPAGLDLAIANKVDTQKDRDAATANIKQAQFPDLPF